jgi:hypothetical protein
MRCGSFVKFEERRRKGSGKPFMKPGRPISWWALSDLGPTKVNAWGIGKSSADLLGEGYVVCDGMIAAEVRIEYGPHRDDETLAVEYRCGKCGQTFFPELPSPYDLNAYLTASIDAMGEEESLREKARSDHQAHYGRLGL